MRILLTGAAGFLGWHTRVRLHALSDHAVVPVSRATWADLSTLAREVDAIVHVAGVNRGADHDIERGNIAMAQQVADAARASDRAPRLVFANSTQCGNDTPYGVGKAVASELLAATAAELGSDYVDVRLPNLFGEHGRPDYNSFVATFVRSVVDGRNPTIVDREVGLLHAQDAAQSLIDGLEAHEKRLDPVPAQTTVRNVFDTLHMFNALYDSGGDIPPLLSHLDVDLFNTLRAIRFPARYPISLEPRNDDRGRLIEVVRAHGGPGQTFVSTTRPGITRGEHFHLRKIERFVVTSGQARISLRRLFSDQVITFDVTGAVPVAIDMPAMWAHNITNTGGTELTTLFWTHELFDPAAPDTYPEPVAAPAEASRCSK